MAGYSEGPLFLLLSSSSSFTLMKAPWPNTRIKEIGEKIGKLNKRNYKLFKTNKLHLLYEKGLKLVLLKTV